MNTSHFFEMYLAGAAVGVGIAILGMLGRGLAWLLGAGRGSAGAAVPPATNGSGPTPTEGIGPGR